jgi:hypothetical protein
LRCDFNLDAPGLPPGLTVISNEVINGHVKTLRGVSFVVVPDVYVVIDQPFSRAIILERGRCKATKTV